MTQEKLITSDQTLQIAGIGRAFKYLLIKKGQFPPPVKVGRRSFWVQDEVQQWVRDQIERRNAASEEHVA